MLTCSSAYKLMLVRISLACWCIEIFHIDGFNKIKICKLIFEDGLADDEIDKLVVKEVDPVVPDTTENLSIRQSQATPSEI